MVYLSIKNWADEDKPREKLLDKGVKFLTDAELMAILLGTGTKDVSAVELSKNILSGYKNNLNELGRSSVDELTKIKGIGRAKAITIIAALELGKRRNSSEVLENPVINTSSDVNKMFHPLVSDLPHEEFWVAFLNRSNKLIEKKKISQGGIAGTVIDVRIILKRALELLASSLVLCHNHPSGNIMPSENDKNITGKIGMAASQMDIQLLDHVIIGSNKYYSFIDEGLL